MVRGKIYRGVAATIYNKRGNGHPRGVEPVFTVQNLPRPMGSHTANPRDRATWGTTWRTNEPGRRWC